jgi:putative transposase
MNRQPFPLVVRRNESLLQGMRELKAEHLFWGYRRIWASLHFVERRAINKKPMLRQMREPHLPIPPPAKLNAKRRPMGANSDAPSQTHGGASI